MSQPILVVDAFTDRPFAGNPAAVCLLPAPADEAWMRSISGARSIGVASNASARATASSAPRSARRCTPTATAAATTTDTTPTTSTRARRDMG